MLKYKIILMVLLVVGFLCLHEFTHVAVNYAYGCQSEFKIMNIGLAVIPHCEDISQESTKRLNDAQAQVENIGYQIGVMLLIISLISVAKWE